MKWYLCVLFLLALAGCRHHRLINRSAVKMIKVVRYRDEADSITVLYNSPIKIRQIINEINDSEKQPLDFEMNCKVHIVYADSTATVLCGGTAIRYKGTTYKMDESMEEILN